METSVLRRLLWFDSDREIKGVSCVSQLVFLTVGSVGNCGPWPITRPLSVGPPRDQGLPPEVVVFTELYTSSILPVPPQGPHMLCSHCQDFRQTSLLRFLWYSYSSILASHSLSFCHNCLKLNSCAKSSFLYSLEYLDGNTAFTLILAFLSPLTSLICHSSLIFHSLSRASNTMFPFCYA